MDLVDLIKNDKYTELSDYINKETSKKINDLDIVKNYKERKEKLNNFKDTLKKAKEEFRN
nr:MAG TPA: hypothetical protein [Caudoviricetes sp.]